MTGHRPHRSGCVVVIAGPDGAGKSTLSETLSRDLSKDGPVLRVHHRFGYLRFGKPRSDVTRPHAAAPYPTVVSWLKSLYLYWDYLLGWFLRVRPLVHRGGCVLIERGWWDLLVDQRRYRLQRSRAFLGFLGNLLPSPDIVLVLEGPAAALRERKAELPEEELARQLKAWRSVLPKRVHREFLNAFAFEDDRALRACAEARKRKAEGRQKLPAQVT